MEWEACRGEVWAVEGVMVVVAGLVMVALLLVVYMGDEASEVSASSCRRSSHSGNLRSPVYCETICRQRCQPLDPTSSSIPGQPEVLNQLHLVWWRWA